VSDPQNYSTLVGALATLLGILLVSRAVVARLLQSSVDAAQGGRRRLTLETHRARGKAQRCLQNLRRDAIFNVRNWWRQLRRKPVAQRIRPLGLAVETNIAVALTVKQGQPTLEGLRDRQDAHERETRRELAKLEADPVGISALLIGTVLMALGSLNL
jgi:hypothetical protein